MRGGTIVIDQNSSADPKSEGAIRIILADTQAIYRVGTKKIFAIEDDIRVVAQAETLGQVLAAAQKFPADVILFETAVSTNPPEAVSEVLRRSPKSKIVVLVGEMDEDDTLEYFRRGVKGIISRAISPEMLIKCVRKIAEGESWIDNQAVTWVIEAYKQQAAQLMTPRNRARLSDKELLIISCVTQGLRNKEIANELNTSEQVIKNYLRKVYDKLGVSDRLELALYCIHHQLLKSPKTENGEQSPDQSNHDQHPVQAQSVEVPSV
ncbi:MAG: response regulator transcription factor [Acidobacteriaceae bacterium]